MEISNSKNLNLQERGVVLIITSLVLVILLFLGAYFLSFTLTEFRISQSEVASAQTYYLSEAGVNEVIWRLKNDSSWKENFETDPGCYTWQDTLSREGTLLPKGSYQVQIQNSNCARGEIVATSTLDLAEGKVAQRVVKTKIFKSLGSLTNDSAIFSTGPSENIDFNSSVVNIYSGNLLGNNNIHISSWSDVNIFDDLETEEVEGKVLAGNNLDIHWSSSLYATASCAKNVCEGDCLNEGCPPDDSSAPMVDFDSEDSNSYKNKALAAEGSSQCSVLCNGLECGTKCVYTDDEFEDLLWQVGKDGVITLNNEITYIEGLLKLRGGRGLVINGALVTDGTIDIGEKQCWTRQGQKDCGYNLITVNDPGQDIPSGILTKSKLDIGPYSSFQDIEITGLIYALDEIKIVSLPWSFEIIGGIISRKFSLTSAWSSFNIYLNNSIISEGIWGGPQPPEGESPPYSPLVTIEHWEESY